MDNNIQAGTVTHPAGQAEGHVSLETFKKDLNSCRPVNVSAHPHNFSPSRASPAELARVPAKNRPPRLSTPSEVVYLRVSHPALVETPLAERAVENTLVGHQATTPPEAEVLVRVNLHDTPVGPHDLEEWKAWLTANVPGSVGHLSVVMAEPSNSRLLILRVSMPLWDFLPDSNAYIFCGRVIPGEGKKPMS
ncbi:hypothetical protein FN846DRAFT_1025565 [Sphaerosporella brunnea]|uniref:Uncharacterized protein n=1 Tax=Sphaerosporella brunnea TaxID=1250544 RepID=A0A5J5EE90_9PEZI|nr:hypothetical protein FN846DRAFT_1025565 [Sphaerosporella brunnea]